MNFQRHYSNFHEVSEKHVGADGEDESREIDLGDVAQGHPARSISRVLDLIGNPTCPLLILSR